MEAQWAVAALAAIVYTARLGQAKADAGTGYELFAITAVVLGGTSIFGGIGSIHGTLLGVAAIAWKSGLAITATRRGNHIEVATVARPRNNRPLAT